MKNDDDIAVSKAKSWAAVMIICAAVGIGRMTAWQWGFVFLANGMLIMDLIDIVSMRIADAIRDLKGETDA